MNITPDNYLGIVPIIVNEVIGGVILTLILGMVVITWLSIVNNMPTRTTLALNAVWVLLFLSIYYNQFVLALIIVLIGFIAYTAYVNWFQT